MKEEERIYNVPLRKSFLKVPKYKRAKKAVNALKEFLKKHMKSDNINIGETVNKEIWKNGIRNPPHHIKVSVKKEDDVVKATMANELKAKKTVSKKVEKTEKKTPSPKAPKEETKTEVVKDSDKKSE